MKQGLSLSVSQHLALTPQLQQSIRLLQLSTLELSQEVEQMLDENPFLERTEEQSLREEFGLAHADTPVSEGDRALEFSASAVPDETPAALAGAAEAAAELTQLDEALLNLVVQQSAQIFGKAITLEEAQSRYVPSLKPNEKGYAPTWKCKVNVGGKARVNLWDTGKRRRLTPESWVKAQVWPKAILKSLWIMGKQFGPLFEVGDLMVEEATVECPF